jgi:hypothetical protein
MCILRFPARGASRVPRAAEALEPVRRSKRKPESPTCREQGGGKELRGFTHKEEVEALGLHKRAGGGRGRWIPCVGARESQIRPPAK